jgi:hypothetical protein
MKTIEQQIAKLPSGLLSLVAVLMACFNPPPVLILIAIFLAFAEITLGYIKQQAIKSTLRENSVMKKQIVDLKKSEILSDEIAQSVKKLGHKALPLWSHQIRDCIDISTAEIDQLCEHFTHTIDQLSEMNDKEKHELMIGEYELVASQVIANAQRSIESIQFQDRVSQVLTHVIDSMSELSLKSEGKQAINVDDLLHFNSATYTTRQERDAYREHTGKDAIEAVESMADDEIVLF